MSFARVGRGIVAGFLTCLFTHGLLLGAEPEKATNPPQPSIDESTVPARPDWWGPFYAGRKLLSVDGVLEEDPGGQDLQGVRLGYAFWDEGNCDFNGRHLLSLSYASGEGQRVIRAEANAGILMLGVGPFRAFPTLGAGVEYRGSNPDDGVAGLLNVGFETAIWLPKRWQLAFSVQRQFGFPSGTRNEVGFAVRYSPARLNHPTVPVLPLPLPEPNE